MADFHCRLERHTAGWQMELQFVLAGARFTESFANWLSGYGPGRTLITENWHAEAAGGEVGITLHKGDALTFSPSWILIAQGSALARLNRRKENLSTKTISIALLSPDEPSLMRNPDRRRTRIEVLRRKADWNVKVNIELPNGASLSTMNRSFDRAEVEIGEGKDRVSRGVLLFESLDPQATLICRPNTHHDSSTGIRVALALQGARYAFTLNESRKHVAVFANFSNQTQLLKTSEYFLRFGVGGHTQTFEIVALDGKLQIVKCSPDLLDLSIPLAGPGGAHTHLPLNTKLDRRIQRLLATIDRRPHHKLLLADMARLTSLSPSRLRHKFKSEVGVTPTVYLQNARLKLAEKLMKNGNVSIKEVRAAVGFESDSYFNRLCERFYGRSPSEMKNLWTAARTDSRE